MSHGAYLLPDTGSLQTNVGQCFLRDKAFLHTQDNQRSFNHSYLYLFKKPIWNAYCLSVTMKGERDSGWWVPAWWRQGLEKFPVWWERDSRAYQLFTCVKIKPWTVCYGRAHFTWEEGRVYWGALGLWEVNGTGYLYVLELKLSQFDKPIQFHTIDMFYLLWMAL